jgi:zinc/manganese transport system permease protein
MGIGLLASLVGLEWSYYASLPAGPAIVLSASVMFLISILFGTRGGMLRRARH